MNISSYWQKKKKKKKTQIHEILHISFTSFQNLKLLHDSLVMIIYCQCE